MMVKQRIVDRIIRALKSANTPLSCSEIITVLKKQKKTCGRLYIEHPDMRQVTNYVSKIKGITQNGRDKMTGTVSSYSVPLWEWIGEEE
jgi:hypothetical protein